MKLLNLKYDFKPLETIGDGSCLVHAILQAFSKEYNNFKSDIEKIKLVKQVRFHLSEILELKIEGNKNIYQYLSRGELQDLGKIIPEAKLEYMKRYLNSNNFLTLQYVELLSEIFDINIIFISEKEKDIYHSGDNQLLFKKDRETIFVNYIEQTHFETIQINGKTLFEKKDKVLLDVIKKLKFD